MPSRRRSVSCSTNPTATLAEDAAPGASAAAEVADWHHRYLAASGWAIRMVRGAVQIMAPPWLETGVRKWRNVTKSRTRMTDAIEHQNMTRDDR